MLVGVGGYVMAWEGQLTPHEFAKWARYVKLEF